MQESKKALKKEIIRSLKDHGERPFKNLVDNIWRDDNLDYEFKDDPEKILKDIVKDMQEEGLITRIGDYDDTIQLNYEMLVEDEQKTEVFVKAPWKLRAFGELIITNLEIIDKNKISSIFRELQKKKEINSYFHLRENYENHFELSWSYQGLQANLFLFPSGEFVIEVYFSGKEHPELIKNPELAQDTLKILNQSILGTGFFQIYQILKKLIQQIFEYAPLRIRDFRYIRVKE